MLEVQKQLEKILEGDLDKNIDNLHPINYSELQNIIFLSSEIQIIHKCFRESENSVLPLSKHVKKLYPCEPLCLYPENT